MLGLAHYPSVMELLQPRMKREVATRIVQTLLAAGTQVTTVDQVEMLFRCVLDDCLNDNVAKPCGGLFGARQPGGWGGGSARMQRSRLVQLDSFALQLTPASHRPSA